MPTTAQKLADIHAACFPSSKGWGVENFTVWLDGPQTLYTLTEHGFAFGRWLDAEQVELTSFAVIPERQNKGLGKTLLNDFIAKVKKEGGKIIFLEVAANNAPALHLYKKLGFQQIGLRPAYYEKPNAPNIDAITMRFLVMSDEWGLNCYVI